MNTKDRQKHIKTYMHIIIIIVIIIILVISYIIALHPKGCKPVVYFFLRVHGLISLLPLRPVARSLLPLQPVARSRSEPKGDMAKPPYYPYGRRPTTLLPLR